MALTITQKDKEVTNPVLRALDIAWATVMAVFTICILIPLSLPTHLLLKLFGRQGFVKHNTDGTIEYLINKEGFYRRPADSQLT